MKIVLVKGDLTEFDLGLDPEDLKMLQDEVNMNQITNEIFHSK